jgi:hypothetical protein
VNQNHVCREGENIGMDWKSHYPHVLTFCKLCRKKLREIPLDDIPPKFEGVAGDIITYMRERGRRP